MEPPLLSPLMPSPSVGLSLRPMDNLWLTFSGSLPKSLMLRSSLEFPPIRVGVVFCGRQSPGGHNVIWGLHNALKIHNPNSFLLGFLGGSEGLFAEKTLEITDSILSTYKNQGGYDLLGHTKDQIRTTEQVNAALVACNNLKLDGLSIIGGVTSNTDAAQLAETFALLADLDFVVGVPVLNGDLKNEFVGTAVGFDTICGGHGLCGQRLQIDDHTLPPIPN